MIITQMMGGLGNQMFQYAMGASLAKRLSTSHLLDITWYAHYGSATPRNFMLPYLNTSLCILNRNNRPTEAEYIHEIWPYDERVETIRGDTYLSGYWQNEFYFADNKPAIRNDFTLKLPIAGFTLKSLASSIRKCGNTSVSVHFRRGDYVSNPETHKFHGICSPDYYRQALQCIASKTQTPLNLFVFSDDMDWVQANFRPQHHVCHYINTQKIEHNDLFDLAFMAMCSHHIIANSSFSWWGAWLGEKENSITCAPEKWFADPADTRNPTPERWIKIA